MRAWRAVAAACALLTLPAAALGTDESLLAWAARQPQEDAASTHENADVFLVVGVKTAALSGFADRQTIRQTWADPQHYRSRVARVVFLACAPDTSNFSLSDAIRWRQALELERKRFGDVLTEELEPCVDSYYRLVEKTTMFLHWVTKHYPRSSYAMVADDDIYLRIDHLLTALEGAPRSRFYGGQVWSLQFKRAIWSIRIPTAKNYVSSEAYPMAQLPHFAAGPHYVVSADIARFVSRNRAMLRGVGTLEDVTVAFWLFALVRVQPRRVKQFDGVRFKLCSNRLVSYADLSRQTLRHIHANERRLRAFCRGFSPSRWAKAIVADERADAHAGNTSTAPVSFEWDFRWLSGQTVGILTKTQFSSGRAVTKLYAPALRSHIEFCSTLHFEAVSLGMTTLPAANLCEEHRALLTEALVRFRTAEPASSHLFALSLTNLQQGIRGMSMAVLLTDSVVFLRTIIECLFSEAYPDAHVFVLGESNLATTSRTIELDFVVMGFHEYTVRSESKAIQPVAERLLVVSHGVATPRTLVGNASLHISPQQTRDSPQHHLRLPLASMAFTSRQDHTPLSLLRSTGNDLKVRSFDICVIGHVAQSFLGQLAQSFEALRADSLSGNFSDTDLDDCRFVLVNETAVDSPLSAANALVSAFLAGSIPVWFSTSLDSTAMFNPAAFIACASSLDEKCLHQLHFALASSSTYEVMLREPPITNQTEFAEAFSWHPAVAAWAMTLTGRPLLLGERLKLLIDEL